MGHWYEKKGIARHQVPNNSKTAKSPMRDTTLRDARKLSLLPSFSTIAGQLNSPGLNTWLNTLYIDHIYNLLGSLELNPKDEEAVMSHKETAKRNAEIEKNSYANLGSQIHNAVEESIYGTFNYDPDLQVFVNAFWKGLCNHFKVERNEIEFVFVEATFAANNLGFGGTVDYIIKIKGVFYLVDLKSKKTTVGKKAYLSESNLMQLPAYKNGFNVNENTRPFGKGSYPIGWKLPSDTIALDIIVSSSEPGRCEVEVISEEDEIKYWKMFRLLRDLWVLCNDYDPRD